MIQKLEVPVAAPRTAEEELVRRAAAGDRGAFEALYRRHVRAVYNLAYRMAGKEDAEELTQEIFLQIYRALPGFRGHSRLYTWIYRIASNVCLLYRKRKARQREVSLETLAPAQGSALIAPASRDPSVQVERRNAMERLVHAIRGLPPQLALVVALGPVAGHSHEEIAHILGCSLDAVKGRLHRARLRLRRDVPGGEAA